MPFLTRERDVFVTLADRVNQLNRSRCALVLSLHINAAVRSEPRYISAFICGRGGRAETAAGRLLGAVVQATGWPNGGVRTQPFYVLRKTTAPAVLLELGFISNPEQERELLRTEVQDNLAGVISREIAEMVV
ncbi:MAG: N-acetylmuramoyl-L-alanine amidase family protein [Syntrophomonadales bacterium]